jgi:hypothetical protein
MNKHWISFSWIILFLLHSCCWYYSLRGTLPPHINNVNIPLFEDRTAEFNIQQIVTDQIKQEFIQENLLKLVSDENPQSTLRGTILSIQDSPLVFTDSETGEAVKEYRITIRIDVEWFDNVNNKSLFKKTFSGYSEYDPTGTTVETRELALQNSLSQITEDIINAILAGW